MDAFSETLHSKHINDAIDQLAAFDKLKEKVVKHETFKKP